MRAARRAQRDAKPYHSMGMYVVDVQLAAHSESIALFGTTPARQPLMGPLGESHGPPSLPAEVPSLVCQKSPNGPGLAPSQYSIQ